MTPDEEARDPRVARSRAAVLAATVELLGELGHSGTTVEAVAQRSGVAKTTIYRHWPTRATLLLDAFHGCADHQDLSPSGDVRQDLLAMAGGLATKLRDPRWSRIMATLIDAAESDPELSELSAAFTFQRREAVRSIIDRGVESGELRAGIDTDLAAQLVGGTLFYQRLLLRRAADDQQLQRIVDLVLDGLRA